MNSDPDNSSFFTPGGRSRAAAAKTHVAPVRYREFFIAPKADFDSFPWIIGGRAVTAGFEVLCGNGNPIPARAWFLTDADARRAVDLILELRRMEAWWRMAWETGLTVLAGGSLVHRGHTVRQRVVAWGQDHTECAHTDGFDVFRPAPHNLDRLLPGNCYFQTLPEAIEGINLALDGNGREFDACFWRMVYLANEHSGMIGHGTSLMARATEDIKAGEEEAEAEFRLDLETRAAERRPLAVGAGDYRAFIHETWFEGESGDPEDRRTKVWSVSFDVTLAVLEGDACTLENVKGRVDAFFQGFKNRGARGNGGSGMPDSEYGNAESGFDAGTPGWQPEAQDDEDEETEDDGTFDGDASTSTPITRVDRLRRFRPDGQN